MNYESGQLEQLISYAQDALIEERIKSNSASGSNSSEKSSDAILFLGNRHETVPRRLLLDPRLGATEKVAWQMMQLMANDMSHVAFPTYDQLRPLLRAKAGESASKATVNRVITILRLTRWLTLGRRVRDKGGYVLGNVYLLHDEPIEPIEANQVDPDYWDFVMRSLIHNNRAIAATAESVVDDVMTSGLKTLPSRLESVLSRLNTHTEFSMRTQSNINNLTLGSRGELSSVLDENSLSSPREPSPKSKTYNRVLIENSVPTVSNVSNSIVSTIPFELHSVFQTLEPKVLKQFLDRVRDLNPSITQNVIDECAGRLLLDNSIKKPGPYLSSIIMRALTDRFHLSDYGIHVQSLRHEKAAEFESGGEASSVPHKVQHDFLKPAMESTHRSQRDQRKKITDSIMDIDDTNW